MINTAPMDDRSPSSVAADETVPRTFPVPHRAKVTFILI